MHLKLSPVFGAGALSVARKGDTIIINGVALDLADLPPGGTLPHGAVGCDLIAGPVTRGADGALCVPLILPHDADAPEDVRLPAPVTVEKDGPVEAPGLTAWDGDVTPGAIDWSQLETAQARADQALADWRAGCEIPRLSLVLALVQAGIISQQSAIAAASGGIPAEFEPIVAALPDPPQTEVRIRWAGAANIARLSPFIAAIQRAAKLTDAQVDALFGWGA